MARNLTPFFAADTSDAGYWASPANFESTDDGWAHYRRDQTAGAVYVYARTQPFDFVELGKTYTLLVELKNATDNAIGRRLVLYSSTNTQLATSGWDFAEGVTRIPVRVTAEDATYGMSLRFHQPARVLTEFDIRLSIYEGDYDGPYLAYTVEEDRPQTPRVLVYSHADEPFGELDPADVMDLRRTEEVNGEHCLSITTTQILNKGMRILMQDTMGVWREYVVAGTDENHENGRTAIGTYYCTWSLQHDLSVTPVSVMPGTQSPVRAAAALELLLSTTARWGVGTVTRTSIGGASMYRTTAWEALGVLTEVWGGEIDAQIEVGSTGVVSRKVALYDTQGKTNATRRFDWGGDITGIRRTVEDVPNVCRIIPLGKGEQTEGGGYGRKITIESVNGGKDYLENSSMAPLCRMPDGNGGWEYPAKYVENSDMETPADLKLWAESVLEDETSPKVMYEASVLQFAQAGLDVQGVALGDAVHIVDREFDENGVRIQGRVMKLAVNELDPTDISCTIGNLSDGLAGAFSSLSAKVERVTSTVSNMNGGNLSTADYLNRLLGMVNNEINAGGGYTYLTHGQGIRTYDKAVSDPLVGTEADKVVEIKGGSMRIADSRTSSGEWDWRTVFTSGHIASDMVTAASITAGYIGSSSEGNYWNLDTGELRMANTATIGGKRVSQLIADVDATISHVDVQFAQNQSTSVPPTAGWSTAAPEWREGYHIWQRTATTSPTGTSYSTPVCISGRDGVDGSSVSILGSYNTLAELQAAHPTGNTGDGYIVAGDLYVWDGTQWDNVGQVQGPQGPAGADGIGIDGIQEQYYLSTSPTSQTGGSWSTAQPEWESGKYIWTRSRIDWSDGATTYTDPVLAQAINAANESAYDAAAAVSVLEPQVQTATSTAQATQAKVDAMSVGGTNLLTGTNKLETVSTNPSWSSLTWGGTSSGTGARAVVNVTDAPNNGIRRGLRITGNNTKTDISQLKVPLSPDEEYVLSCYARGSTTSTQLYMAVGNGNTWKAVATNVSTAWRRYYMKFKGDIDGADITDGKTTVVFGNHKTGTLYVCGMKLERGTVATDWGENPFDSSKKAVDAATQALDKAKTYTNEISETDRQFTESQRKALDESLNQAGIFNRLTNNGQTQGIYLQNGRVYINASYMQTGTLNAGIVKAGILSDTKGANKWNMATGYLETKNMVAKNAQVTGQVTAGPTDGTKMVLQSGRLDGFHRDSKGKTRVGYISPSAKVWDKDNKKYIYGLQLQANGTIRLSSPKISVRNSSDITKDTITAWTGKLTFRNLTFGMNSRMTACKTGDITLEFINGLLVTYGKPKGM